MVYRIEVSPNNRAGCKNTECKNAGIKISKGQMRFGAWVEGPDFQSWSWKHWGCVTPKQIENLKKSIDDDATELDGFEDLPEEFQDKIRIAVQEGHVADEDWGGDAEMNRAGMNGYRTPASKTAKKEALKDAQSPSPSKIAPKKRGHVKDDPNDDEVAEHTGPARKKRKAAVKQGKVKKEENHGGSADEAPPAKKGRKKSTKIKAEGDPDSGHEGVVSEPPVVKARAPRRAAAAMKIKYEDAESDAPSDALETASRPSAKKIRAPRNRAAVKKIKEEDVDVARPLDIASDSAASPPAKKKRAPRNVAAAMKSKSDEAQTGADTDAPHSTNLIKEATSAHKRKAATKLKAEDDDVPTQPTADDQNATGKTNGEEIETKDVSQDDGRATELAPMASKKGSKKPIKKSINGTEAIAAKEKKETPHQARDPGEEQKPRRTDGRVTRSR